MSNDSTEWAEVINMRKKRLHIKETNCWSVLVESANEPALDCYASIHNCAKCGGSGQTKMLLSSQPSTCPGCNGFGILIKLLRPEQVPDSTYGFRVSNNPGPVPTGPSNVS